jgi:biotin carboxyl carrier protein
MTVRWTEAATREDRLSETNGDQWLLPERLIIAPCKGKFRLSPPQHFTTEGEYVVEGQVVGHITALDGHPVPVESQFAGWVMGFLVRDGYPVNQGEPVAWLRRL